MATLMRSPAFWIVCLMSLGLTLLRETFNNWTPTYLVEAVGLSTGSASPDEQPLSIVWRCFGDPGRFPGRPARTRRPGRDHPDRVSCSAAWRLGSWARSVLPAARARSLGLVSLVAFLLIGPYSYLAGAISLDFGGKRGAQPPAASSMALAICSAASLPARSSRPFRVRWDGRASS